MTHFRNILTLSATGVLMLLGCKDKEPKDLTGMVNAGVLEIWCDESLQKIIEQQEDVYETSYTYADIKINYASETEVKKLFYSNSANVIVISSMIDSNDIKKFNEKNIFPRQHKFATSALAFIVNKSNVQDTIKEETLISMLKSDASNTHFVIENAESGIANALIDLIGTKNLSKNVFAKKNKQEVIDWIENHPEAIGVIDWSEISDSDDAEAKEILKKFKLVGISTRNSNGEYFKPYQYNLNGNYPFTRDLYFIRSSGKTDLSLGFSSFICSDRGQKIILKSGLLPTYQTERIIEFKSTGDFEIVK